MQISVQVYSRGGGAVGGSLIGTRCSCRVGRPADSRHSATAIRTEGVIIMRAIKTLHGLISTLLALMQLVQLYPRISSGIAHVLVCPWWLGEKMPDSRWSHSSSSRQHGEGNRVFNMKLIYWCETRWSEPQTDRQTECNLVAAVVANKFKPQNEP